MVKKCNNCGFQQDNFLNLGGKNYCVSCNSEININNLGNQSQDLIQRKAYMTAYEKKAVHDIFVSTIEWFEKYIEIVHKNKFPNWENRKQVRDNFVVTRKDIYEDPKRAEEGLAGQLHLFSSVLEDDTSAEFEKEMKQEFYKWISAVGIDINNCPERLKHFMFGLNEIFEGNYEKIRHDIANRKREIEVDDPKYMDYMMKVFSHTQVSMYKEEKVKKSMEGKDPNEVKFGNFSGGNKEQGQKTFEKIAKNVAGSHENFYFGEQKDQQVSSNLNNSLIEKVRQNPNDWSIKEIITFKGYFNGRGEIKKLALVHKDANLRSYDWRDNLRIDPQLIYFAEEHQGEWFQIEQFLGEFQRNWQERINDIKQNISQWNLGSVVTVYEVCGEDWYEKKKDMMLIRQDAQGGYDNNGNLVVDPEKMFYWEKFSSAEQTEIQQAWTDYQATHQLNSPSQQNQFYKQSISFLKSKGVDNSKKNNNIGTGGILAMVAGVSVLAISGAVVIKKKLNKKNRG